MKRTVGLLLILALLCGGCSLMLQSGLTAGNSQRIESAHGFAFRVPSDWLMEEVDAEHVQYRFHSAEEDIYLTVVMELGGMAYDSTTEIGAALAEQLAADLYDEVETERAEETETSYRCLLRGMDADGAALVSELYLYAPFVSARYYLLFQAADAVYDESRKMIDDVIASFALTMTREEVYAHMREMREDAANASAQEDAETATDMESEAEGAGTGTEGGGQ